MTPEEFKNMSSLIYDKLSLEKEIEELRKRISDINTKIKDPVQEIFKPLIGRYFRKTGNIVHPNHNDLWFTVIDVPKEKWMMIGGCTFDEWMVPARIMQSDGMMRRGNIGISPQNFRDDGKTLPIYIIEVSEDEWFAEQRRRVHEEADRKLKEAIPIKEDIINDTD